MLAGGSSVPLISVRKGTEPPLEARALHTLRLMARQPPTSVTSLRSAHWLASDFHSWINSWIDCQTNVYKIWPPIHQFNQLLNQQLDRLFVRLSDPYSHRANAITLVGELPVITGNTAWNWRRAVLSADAGLLVLIIVIAEFSVVVHCFSLSCISYRWLILSCLFHYSRPA